MARQVHHDRHLCGQYFARCRSGNQRATDAIAIRRTVLAFYYDVNRVTATGSTGGTEVTHIAAKTAANQETVSITAMYACGRGGTAGGGAIRVKHNTGTVYSGGGAALPQARNLRLGAVLAAASTWVNDSVAITAGTVLVQRLVFGFAQTGGSGGWQATEASNRIQMMPNGVNPVDIEITSIAAGTTLPLELTAEFGEGV